MCWSGICLRDAEGEGSRLIDSMGNELEVSLRGDRRDQESLAAGSGRLYRYSLAPPMSTSVFNQIQTPLRICSWVGNGVSRPRR